MPVKIKKLFVFLSILNVSSFAGKVFSSKFLTRIMQPTLNDCDVAFIYAEIPEVLLAPVEKLEFLSLQFKYLHAFMHDDSIEHYFLGNHFIPVFKPQHQFLEDHHCCSKTFLGKNEMIFRNIYSNSKFQLPCYYLSYLSLEYMLRTMLIIQVFDISALKEEQLIFRQAYSHESLALGEKNISLQHLPILLADDRLLGSPFLKKNQSLLSLHSRKILIMISQFGRTGFEHTKQFHEHVDSFVRQSSQKCHIHISKVSLFKGLPVIDSVKSQPLGSTIFYHSGN